MEKTYQPQKIESKWQKIWEKNKAFLVDLKQAKNPYFNLMMFPYPSAEGLHVGNMYAFAGSDIWGRYMAMKGYDVLEPIGLDGFGIHSENYALKVGKHPKTQAKISEKNFYRQLKLIGNRFSWDNKVETYDPEYYRWTQWIFIQLFKAGLAYRKKALVNWCPSCKTVLADEQVIEGKCERCDSEVNKKELSQWFFKITNYAERLLQNTYKLDWSEKVLKAQRQWIGKSEGINITYDVVNSNGKKVDQVTCFTTRPDTNFGATFIVLAPEHKLVNRLKNAMSSQTRVAIEEYVKKSQTISKEERINQGREKTGLATEFFALNQLTNFPMPIYISDFVLTDVGTGAVVGVPGHDLRDFEFAKKFNLKIIRVVVGKDNDRSAITKPEQVQEEAGTMINSGFLNGMEIHQATKKIIDYLEEKGWGQKTTHYHLRDWLISRQRYWGPPIPMILCPKCGWVTVPEQDLPVLLPEVKDWRPKGTGRGPLAVLKDWIKVSCPKCAGQAERETDVSDTFLDSSWYFLRYPSVKEKTVPWNKVLTQKWLPINMYIGGAEHSVLHLLYSRFITMVFKDLGYLNFEEPYKQFRAHGLIINNGAKMSKSKGNIVNPDQYISKYGADCLRCYLMFLGPLADGGDFRDTGMLGMYKFLNRVYNFVNQQLDNISANIEASAKEKYWLHKTIKRVTEGIERLKYNTSLAAIMELINFLKDEQKSASQESLKTLIILLAPFAPHLSEELWSKISNQSVHQQSWPKYNQEYLTQDRVEIVIQINGRVRDKIQVDASEAGDKEKIISLAKATNKIKAYLDNKKIIKEIYLQEKLINFVIQ